MKLDLVEMTNWRPFYGTHALECDTSQDRPYVWIHGNNMRGKTAILNAIRWCMYGHTEDSGRKRSSFLNLNKRSLQEGEYQYSVKLAFSHGGQDYILERHAQWKLEPTSDAGKEERVDLRIDGIIQPGDAIERHIRAVLHEEISQFYLFDGEMIREYEDRLASGEGAAFVRNAIERVVGLPAIRRGADDLEGLAAATEQEANKHLRKVKAYEKLSEELERIRVSLETIKADEERLTKREEDLARRQADLEVDLRRFDAVQGRLRERDVLSDRRDTLKKERDVLVQDLSTGLRDRWWFPSMEAIQKRRDAIEDQREAAEAIRVQAKVISGRIAGMRRSIDAEKCDVCGQPISEEHRKQVLDEISKLEKASSESSGDPGNDDLALLTSLRAFRSAEPTVLLDVSRRISHTDVELFSLTTKIREIDDGMLGVDRKTIADTQRDLDNVKADLKEVRDSKRVQADTRSALEAQRREKRKKLPPIPGGNRLGQRLSIFTELAETFTDAVGRFRDSIHAEVSQSALELFSNLTTEPEFQGIEIGEQYAVRILDSNGLPVLPSAAAQQVAALSLIGGLKQAAVREGPLVVDTPLARFDIGHRDRILDNLTLAGDQVLLLLQPGEFDRDRYVQRVGHSVAREYTLERVSDQESLVIAGYDDRALDR